MENKKRSLIKRKNERKSVKEIEKLNKASFSEKHICTYILIEINIQIVKEKKV